MNRKVVFYLCLSLIVYLSIVPPNTDTPSILSKMMFTESGFFQHLFGYFVLSSLACYAFSKNTMWKILAGIFIMGVGLEMIQYMLPARTFNLYDSLANLAGMCAVLMIVLFRKIRKAIYENG